MGRLYAEAQKKMRIEAANEILSYLDQVKDTDNWKDLLIGKLDAMIADYDAQIHKGRKLFPLLRLTGTSCCVPSGNPISISITPSGNNGILMRRAACFPRTTISFGTRLRRIIDSIA